MDMLNDAQIDQFLNLLNNDDVQVSSGLRFHDVYFSNKPRLEKIVGTFCEHSSLHDKKKWLIPYNINGNHWILFVVCIQDHFIFLYDSLIGGLTIQEAAERLLCTGEKIDIADRIREFLYVYGTYMQHPHFFLVPWKLIQAPLTETQQDGVSCGLYVCRIAELHTFLPNNIPVNIGVNPNPTYEYTIQREWRIFKKQLRFNMICNRFPPINVVTRNVFHFDYIKVRYNDDESQLYNISEGFTFNFGFHINHTKIIPHFGVTTIGKFGLPCKMLADVSLPYARKITSNQLTSEEMGILQDTLDCKTSTDRISRLGSVDERVFDFVLELPGVDIHMIQSVIHRIGYMHMNLHAGDYATVVFIDKINQTENDKMLAADFLLIERIVCHVYSRSNVKVRLVIVNPQMRKIYERMKALKYLCWFTNYNLRLDQAFEHWVLKDFFINDQLYSLFTSFPLGFLHIVLYVDIQEFKADISNYQSISMMICRDEENYKSIYEKWGKMWLEKNIIHNYVYVKYASKKKGFEYTHIDMDKIKMFDEQELFNKLVT